MGGSGGEAGWRAAAPASAQAGRSVALLPPPRPPLPLMPSQQGPRQRQRQRHMHAHTHLRGGQPVREAAVVPFGADVCQARAEERAGVCVRGGRPGLRSRTRARRQAAAPATAAVAAAAGQGAAKEHELTGPGAQQDLEPNLLQRRGSERGRAGRPGAQLVPELSRQARQLLQPCGRSPPSPQPAPDPSPQPAPAATRHRGSGGGSGGARG